MKKAVFDMKYERTMNAFGKSCLQSDEWVAGYDTSLKRNIIKTQL